jgi:aromatic ring-cleaving dioxygenase
MINNEFNKVSAVLHYHIHLYYERGKETESVAHAIAEEIKSKFGDKIIEEFNYKTLVGPHDGPNIALHFSRDGFADIVSWAQLNSKGLSVLIHPVTGYDLKRETKDHLEDSMWIGQQRGFNMAYFFPELAKKAQNAPARKLK